jgi:hypothetical protein
LKVKPRKEKVSGLPTLPSIGRRMAAELDQANLDRME